MGEEPRQQREPHQRSQEQEEKMEEEDREGCEMEGPQRDAPLDIKSGRPAVRVENVLRSNS